MMTMSPVATSDLTAAQVHETIAKYMLADGFEFVLDLEESQGSTIVDARTGDVFLDLFTFFASSALGMNHPDLADDPEFRAELAATAINKPSNSDIYTVPMARFVQTFARVLGDPKLPHLFFIDGGALAVENALKVAFDWKSRLNESRGLDPKLGEKVLHLEHAFHGRTGYTMSLTNTDPNKTARFPKFDWPRIPSPAINGNADVVAAEQEALAAARAAFEDNPNDIACFIMEPIQGEGGDNHFRPEFLQAMQAMCREFDALFILDEVQTGAGMTGTAWAYQQLGVRARHRGVRQEDPGLRHHGRRPRRRDRAQRLPGRVAAELDVGRQPHRHGPRPAHPRDHRTRRADRSRRRRRRAVARRAPRRSPPSTTASARCAAAG